MTYQERLELRQMAREAVRTERASSMPVAQPSTAKKKYSVPLGGVGRTMAYYPVDIDASVQGYSYRVMMDIAQYVSSTDWTFYHKSSQADKTLLDLSHWLPQLFEHPNDHMSMIEIMELASLSYSFFGAAYIWAPKFDLGHPMQLHHLHTNRVQIVQDKTEIIHGYVYQTYSGGLITIPPDEMIVSRSLIPSFAYTADVVGYPLIKAAFNAINTNSSIRAFSKRFFDADAVPPVYMKIKAGYSAENEDNVKQMLAAWQYDNPQHQVSGVLYEDTEMVPLSSMDKDAVKQIIGAETQETAIKEICAVLGEPYSKISGEFQNRATAIEVTRGFLEKTINPLRKRFAQAFLRVFSLCEENLAIEWNTEKLIDDAFVLEQRKALGFVPNEVRKEMGLEDIEGGDKYLVPINFTTLDNVLNPPQVAEPPMPGKSFEGLKKKA